MNRTASTTNKRAATRRAGKKEMFKKGHWVIRLDHLTDLQSVRLSLSRPLCCTSLSESDATADERPDYHSKLPASLASGLPRGSLSVNPVSRGILQVTNKDLMENSLLDPSG